jgi:FkbM family methyltransferase
MENTNTLRIISHSNAPFVGTGYGVQNALNIRAWKALGHKVIAANFYGNQGAPLNADDVLMLPTSKDAYGNDVLIADFKRWNADITITLIDAWIFNPQVTSQIKWVPYFPVDTDPLPPIVAQILRTAFKPIAYSKFGVEKCVEAGISVEYVPHGVDTKAFAPMDKSEARKMLKMGEEQFLVSIVAANKGTPSRKCFDQQIRAFAEFNKRHPNSVLYLHTDMRGGYDGEDVGRIIEMAGIPPSCIATPPEYEFMRGMIDQAYMRRVYCASDVLLNATRGEGFGVPIIEAMACGTPAIVTDATAMPELVDAGAGYKVAVADKFFYLGSYQFIPSVASIVDALEQAYTDKQSGKLAEMSVKAREGMVKEYDVDHVAQTYWKPVLEKISGELADIKARTERRAQQRADGRAKVGLTVDCTHQWLPTALWINGALYSSCAKCAAGLNVQNGVITPDIFPMSVFGHDLNIEDDPQGSVARVICREVEHDYQIDKLDIKDGDTIIDIGAHVGIVSIALAKLYPNAKIVAYEPFKPNFDRLVRNLAKNGVTSVTAHNAAVSDKAGTIVLHGDPTKNSGGMSIYGNGMSHYIECVAFADILKDYSEIALLKIDCEGAEYDILNSDPLFGVKAIRGEFHHNNVRNAHVLLERVKVRVPDTKVTIVTVADETPQTGNNLSELVDIVATELDGRPILTAVSDTTEVKTETAAD